MKKLLASLIFLSIATSLEAQWGYSRMRFPPAVSPPVTCTVLTQGRGYTDTDDGLPYYCNGTTWTAIATGAGGAPLAGDNAWTGLNTFNRTAAGVDATFGGVEGDANSISIDGDLGCIKFEGASADAAETHLCGDGAPDGGLFLRNGAAASPSFLNIFNTYTDASNNEGLLITWAGPNIAEILTTAAGTGVRRDLRLLANGSYLNLTSAGAAGASGTFAEFNTVLNIMNGTDTQNVVAINPTNANHTGASNIFNALSVGAIAQDADASERGVSVTGGSESWDASLSFVKGSATDFGRIHWFDGATSRALVMVDASDLFVRAQSADLELYGEDGIHFESNSAADNFIFNPEPNAAGGGSTFATVQATLGIMDGSDTVNALAINLTNADHTGSTNVVNGISVGNITADAQATEVAVNIGTGWDTGIRIPDGTSALPAIAFGSDVNTGIFSAGGGSKISIGVDASTSELLLTLNALEWKVSTIRQFLVAGTPSAGTSGSVFSIPTALTAMDGSDTVSLLALNPTNANHTGVTNELRALSVPAITGDVDATEIGVSIGSGWDQGFLGPAGTAALPTFGWTADPDSGFLNPSADTIGLSLAGVQNWAFATPPAAGTGGSLAALTATLTAQDGTDTVNGLAVNITNANHTGSTNVVAGVSIGSITADAQSQEAAIVVKGSVSAGSWDYTLMSDPAGSNLVFAFPFGYGAQFVDTSSGAIAATISARPSAGATGNLISSGSSLTAMDGSDTVKIFSAQPTNANHTGTGNTLIGFAATAITGDADATEVGVSVGSGWDQGITVPAGTAALPAIAFTADTTTGLLNPSAGTIGMSLSGVQNWAFAAPPAAGSGGTLETLTATLTAQDGSDTTNALAINLTNANHTGATNVVNAISIGAFTGDAQAEENGILIGSGPDFPLQLPTTGTLALGFTSDLNTGLRRRADNVFCLDAGGTDNLCVDGNAAVQTVVSIRNFPDAVVAVVAGPPAAGASGDIFEGRLAANITAMNGSDAVNGFSVSAFTDANHTSTGNTLNAFSAGAITSPDADALQTGVAVAAGWKQVIQQVGGVVFAGLPATATGQLQMTFCSDCQGAAGVSGAACANGGTGALAISVRNAFICIH